jgi:hypothetical protein
MIKDKTTFLDLSSKNQEDIKLYLEAILAAKYKLAKNGFKLSVKKTKQNQNKKNAFHG